MLYVAITRAGRGVFLPAYGGAPSPFVKELLHYGDDVTAFGRLPQSDVWCPKSGDGRSVRRENAQDQSLFYGYSHYPY